MIPTVRTYRSQKASLPWTQGRSRVAEESGMETCSHPRMSRNGGASPTTRFSSSSRRVNSRRSTSRPSGRADRNSGLTSPRSRHSRNGVRAATLPGRCGLRFPDGGRRRRPRRRPRSTSNRREPRQAAPVPTRTTKPERGRSPGGEPTRRRAAGRRLPCLSSAARDP